MVGRGDDCQIKLSDRTVSRSHFQIVPDPSAPGGNRWRLVDLGSRNRTVVNDAPTASHSLEDGDRIHIGVTTLAFVDHGGQETTLGGQRKQSTITLEIKGLTEVHPGERSRLAGVYRFAERLSLAIDRAELCTAIEVGVAEVLPGTRLKMEIADDEARPSRGQVPLGPALRARVMQGGHSVTAVISQGLGEVPVMAAPLVSKGRTLGLLALAGAMTESGQGFTEADLSLLTALAQQAGLALDNMAHATVLKAENARLRAELSGGHAFVGQAPALQPVISFIGKVAPTPSTVLLTGESGTGKEVVARSIHQGSGRAEQPFVAVNCAALAESLIESELFGHEKGAFTGATTQKAGRFEQAHGGTLFLDEIGELPLASQARFLRVLEESRFERVGGTKTVTVDVRVVAATNRDLKAMAHEGRFRADLYYRLQVLQLKLPPLRDRREDIPALVHHFLRRGSSRRVQAVDPMALDALVAYRWPGNIRELRNVVERALVLGEGATLRLEDLPLEVVENHSRTQEMAQITPPSAMGHHMPTPASEAPLLTLKQAEQRAIERALAHTRGNKAQAAALLAIDRSTLYKKIRDYGIVT